MLGQQWHRRIYILFLLLFTIGLSFGKILLSISLIGMLVNYVTEGNFKSKRSLFLANQYILVGLLSIFLIEFIWLIFTNNLSNGLNSLRIKLPLLILPLFIYSFVCQYARPIKTSWNGSLPHAISGDIPNAAPFVWAK